MGRCLRNEQSEHVVNLSVSKLVSYSNVIVSEAYDMIYTCEQQMGKCTYRTKLCYFAAKLVL